MESIVNKGNLLPDDMITDVRSRSAVLADCNLAASG
jgi:hypothetical protein